MLTIVEILRATRERIDTPEKWWRPGHPFHGECALVALREIADDVDMRTRLGACDALARAMDLTHGFQIPQFNNAHTHAEVLAAIDRSIADQEAIESEHAVEPIGTPQPALI